MLLRNRVAFGWVVLMASLTGCDEELVSGSQPHVQEVEFVGAAHNAALAQALGSLQREGGDPCEVARRVIRGQTQVFGLEAIVGQVDAAFEDETLMAIVGCGPTRSSFGVSPFTALEEKDAVLSTEAASLVDEVMDLVNDYRGLPWLSNGLGGVELQVLVLQPPEQEFLLALTALTQASAEYWTQEGLLPVAQASVFDLGSFPWFGAAAGPTSVLAADAGGCVAGGLWGLRSGTLQGGAGGCLIGGTSASIVQGFVEIFG